MYRRLPLKRLLTLLLALLLLGIGSWFVHQQARTVTYVIPAGTGRQIEAGQSVAVLPNKLVFIVGVQDTLVIENRDTVQHTLGPFVIPPQTTFSHRFRTPWLYDGQCSLHRGQSITLMVKPAPWWYIFP